MKAFCRLKRLLPLATLTGLWAASLIPAPASQVVIPLDTNSSSLWVELCVNPGIGQRCDSETRPVSGFVVVALDDNASPSQVALRNFDLRSLGNYNLELNWGLLGRMTVNARNLRLYHARPGPANPFLPLLGTNFTATDVPAFTEGTADYTVTGLLCGILEGMGYPCSSNVDLSTVGESSLDTVPGSLEIRDGRLYLTVDIQASVPLDESQPDLGTFSFHGILRGSAPLPRGIVPLGADWRYLDTGIEAPWDWTYPEFDDSAWPFGPAQLGYGEGDEATTNSFGPDPNNKYITTYYRYSFRQDDPYTNTTLTLRLLRDDGAIVYLNGLEVFRSNMPTGAVNYLTPASVAVGGIEEQIFFTQPLDPALLLLGRNVLAVEVHQSAPTSSDLSFDLELLGNTTLTNAPPTVAITNPPNGGFVLGRTLTIEATAADPDGVITLVEFYLDGVKVGQDATAPYSVTVTGLCSGTYTLTAVATDNSAERVGSAPVVVQLVRQLTPLVPAGSVWKYRDDGSDQGTAWIAPGFDDRAWPSGPGDFGYGNLPEGRLERTVLCCSNAASKYITYYFRHAFLASNVAALGAARVDLRRDDGAIVYLNGVEVFRSNMPTGPVTYLTNALSAVGGADETNFFPTMINPALLVEGTNLLAVEVHQSSATSSDLAFDLALYVAVPASNQPPLVALTAPEPEAVFAAGADVPIAAQVEDPDGAVTLVEVFDGTNKLAEADSPPFAWLWQNPPSGLHTLTVLATDDCGARSVSAPVTVNVGVFTLVPTGAVWKYLDNGTNFPTTAWRSYLYNDSAWPSGPAELGYGDAAEGRPEATLVGYGPVETNKYITTYFRHTWVVPDRTKITGLWVRLLRDDGAIVYLNGTEVFRSNMTNGPVDYLTPALSTVSGADETNFFLSPFISGTLLRNGNNTLAVEVHQVNPTSSDLSFDLELLAARLPERPRLWIDPGQNEVVLRWPSWAVGYRLESAPTVAPAGPWQPVAAQVLDDHVWRTVRLPADASQRFFRLNGN